MHELAVAEGILGVVLEAANGSDVRRVRIRAGKLNMIVPESFHFSFELVAAGTPAQGARVELKEIPVTVHCKGCEADSLVEMPPFQCSWCSSFDVDVATGQELIVDEVELEDGRILRQQPVDTEELLRNHHH